MAFDEDIDSVINVSVRETDISTPRDISTPNISTPDISTPNISTPNISTPDISSIDPRKTILFGREILRETHVSFLFH